ncbi:MAG TPA: hypothetical protein VJO72_15715, partial [Candidatus Dormibacteraeota bacterium]|nr:hypothetical protein [Candidatus Dormibacteraeota bacterium]
QRWGQSLEELVRQATDVTTVEGPGRGEESWGYVAGSLTEAAGGRGLPAKLLRRITRSRTTDGVVQLGPAAAAARRSRQNGPEAEPPEVVVLASGCLGLIYFARRPGRLTLEEIDAAYPRLIPTLRAHQGVGFLLVRSSRHGAVVIGNAGMHYLETGKVEGVDPLRPFGVNAASHVKRTDGFEHVADLMVNSAYDSETDEVFAFEEMVGSHGGLGGPQSFPFVLVPRGWSTPDHSVVGAEALHQWMRRWLADLGQTEYR